LLQLVERARAKANRLSLDVANGKHQPVAEAVVVAAAIALAGQACVMDILRLITARQQVLAQRVPGFRCIAELKVDDGLLADLPISQIIAHAPGDLAIDEQVVPIASRRLSDL